LVLDGLPVDVVHVPVGADALGSCEPELGQEPNRREILRADERDQRPELERGRSMQTQTSRILSAALVPPRSPEREAKLDVAAAREQPGIPDHTTAVAVNDSPEAEAMLSLMLDASVDQHLGIAELNRPALTDEPHHLGIGVDRMDRGSVSSDERPNRDPLSLQRETNPPRSPTIGILKHRLHDPSRAAFLLASSARRGRPTGEHRFRILLPKPARQKRTTHTRIGDFAEASEARDLRPAHWTRASGSVTIFAMGYADAYLAELNVADEERDRDSAVEFVASMSDLPARVREEELSRYAAAPVMGIVIGLAGGRLLGMDASEDAALVSMAGLARRELQVQRDAGIEAALVEPGLSLVDWVDERAGSRENPEFEALVRFQVNGLLEARARGRERGRLLRAQRGDPPAHACSGCWALRHPVDHYFRRARGEATDPRIRELLDAQIARLSGVYKRLSAAHPAHDRADDVVELDILAPTPSGWRQPITTSIAAVHRGEGRVGERRGLRLVADPAAPFNGMLVSARAGERWLICAKHLDDATLVPIDGSRRISA
jgi:hypothetical protein